MIYTLTLNPALDYTLHLESFEKGDITRSNNEGILVGGKGINVSKILNELETDNVSLGFVAGFTGNAVVDELKSSGIKCDYVTLKNGLTRVNIKLRESDNGGKACETDIHASGPVADASDLAALLDKLSDIKSGDFVVLAGSVPSGLSKSTYQDIMHHFSEKQEGINFVVDTTGDQLLNALNYKPFVIKPNHHELGELFGLEGDDERLKSLKNIVFYAKELQKKGARNVLVSRGKLGAVLISENGEVFEAGIIDRKPVDTVGAGDSMLAGFIAGYIKYGDYQKSLTLATAAANATTFTWGLAKADKIEEMLKLL